MGLPANEFEATLSIAAESSEFSRATSWLESVCGTRGVPPDQRYRLDVCLNEALANVLAHGGRAARVNPIRLDLSLRQMQDAGSARMTLCAAGVEFDPNSHRQKPVPQTLEEAEPGGLGILMMRTYADDIEYRRLGEQNCTSFVIRWTSDKPDESR